jgi:hypothetical protein
MTIEIPMSDDACREKQTKTKKIIIESKTLSMLNTCLEEE